MSKFSFARAALLGVVSRAVPRCTAQASSTCAGVFPTRVAIAEITGSSFRPGLIPWPNGAKAKNTMPFSLQNPNSSVSGRYGWTSSSPLNSAFRFRVPQIGYKLLDSQDRQSTHDAHVFADTVSLGRKVVPVNSLKWLSSHSSRVPARSPCEGTHRRHAATEHAVRTPFVPSHRLHADAQTGKGYMRTSAARRLCITVFGAGDQKKS
jgi:hypothetical protein